MQPGGVDAGLLAGLRSAVSTGPRSPGSAAPPKRGLTGVVSQGSGPDGQQQVGGFGDQADRMIDIRT